MKHCRLSSILSLLLLSVFLVGVCGSALLGGETKKGPINWLKYDTALEQAKKGKKHVLVDFTASWCGWCKKMQATTYQDPKIITTLKQDFVVAMVDGDSYNVVHLNDGDITEKGLTLQYGVRGYPTTWFLEPDGNKIAPAPGYLDAKTMQYILDYVRTNANDKMTFKEFVEQQTLKAGSK